MTEKTADLHIHSFYSDGTMSPEEILEEAIQNNVGLLAITDHDMLIGSLELQELCRNQDIMYVSGVEIDSLEQGLNYHILGYGIDLEDKIFAEFISNNCRMLFDFNSILIKKMEKDYPKISFAEYQAYSYDCRKGGWKALHYLMEKGITTSLREGFAVYIKYDCYHNSVDFPSIRTACNYIHNAGGKAVLAHPGVSIIETDLTLFKMKLLEFIDYGLDGIECYYVTHSNEITQACLKLCEEGNLMITAGSDCHGAFGNAHVGDVNIPISRIKFDL